MVSDSERVLSAKLLIGTATFSTGNAHAFTLYASNAAIRAQGPSGKGGSPLKAGRSRFLIVVVAVTAIATYFAVSAVRP
jgi:hypothetical protein